MCGGRDLILHDVLFAPTIRRNVISVSVLLKLGFDLFCHGNSAKLTFGSTLFGFGHVTGGLIIMDLDYDSFNNNASFSMFVSSHKYDSDVNI